MGKSKYPKQKPLTPAEQAYFLKLSFPGFRILSARNHLECVWTLRPTAISDTYMIEILYTVPSRPRVRVLKPDLRLAAGKTRLPHVFKENDLCLHIFDDWRPDLRISEFIVPWISLWLRFYEFWLLTGEWIGGGHEADGRAK
jgi:hypothetical protein